MSDSRSATATNRFGLGAMPGERPRADDARGWLHAQLRAGPDRADFAALPTSATLLAREGAARRQRRQAGASDGGDALRELQHDGLREIGLRYKVAAITRASFAERLVRFWSNHFAVSIDKGSARLYAAPMEREAIRPHLTGNFADLLIAVESHPAMLRYLDNDTSIGADSRRVQRAARMGEDRRRLGLNENLAREILELHTLGADGGYAQADVQELARAITGWSVLRVRGRNGGDDPMAARADARTGFVFRPVAHEPGRRNLLGKSYAEDGIEQGRAILRDIALHPSTARHLAFKLARHCVQDEPPRALVERMSNAYLRSGGELSALYAAMIDDDTAWSPDARKYKSPDDFLVSTMRAGGFSFDAKPRLIVHLLRELGQPVFMPRSPAGFPDTFGDWAAGDALRKRLQLASTLAARVDDAQTPEALARSVLGEGAVQGDFDAALKRAGSPQDGYALLFASPAFQWRT